MALVVALLTSFILLALVGSLFWIIASTSRQAEYAKNSAIALNLAEAGTADAIYRLNHCGTDGIGNYPFALSTNPFGTSNFTSLPVDILNTSSYAGLQDPVISGTLNNGNYYVGLIDNATETDTIIAVGFYKGVRRILTVPLRGNNDITFARQPISPPTGSVTQGISEAFNKHVIYAGIVVYNAGTVNGNITSTNDILTAITTNTGVTKTRVSSIDNTYFPILTSLAALPVPSWTRTYTDGFRPGPVAFTADYPGSTYNATTDTYTFPTGILIAGTNLEFITGSNPVPVVDISSLTAINSSIKTSGNLTLSGTKTIGTGVVFQPSGTITVDNNTIINGDLIVEGVPLTLNNNNITVNGAVLCDNAIIISNNTTIYASTSNREAAILMESVTGDTVTISVSPAITLGANQIAAVIAYSNAGAVGVSVNANLTPTMNSSQSSIIAYAGSNTANIKIGDSAATNVNGLVYAYSIDAVNVGNITLGASAGNINGALVADGTVALSGGGNLILSYEISSFTGASLSNDIFSGFSGGRRAYVPVWQGWKLR